MRSMTRSRRRAGRRGGRTGSSRRGKARKAVLEAARGGRDLDEDRARYVRVVGYEVPDRDGDGKGEVIALVTTITAMTAAAAPLLAGPTTKGGSMKPGNAQLKTSLRGPGKVLRSKSPDMVRQEIYGYLLTHYALSALICRAATEAGIDPYGVKFKRTVRIVRRRAADPAAFPPEHQERILATVMADITRTKHLNPERRHRTYPRVIKRARHNSYRVKRPGDHGTRHSGPATIKLVNLHLPALAA
jgi:hypothetical protein